MLKKLNPWKIVIKLSLIIIVLNSCSSLAVGPPRLEDRTLLLNPDKAELIYPYFKTECRYIVICKKTRIVERYDLTNKEVRKELIDKGFVFTSKQRWKYN